MHRPRVYLEIDRADLGWRYRVLLGITQVDTGWRPTRHWAIAAGRRKRQPLLKDPSSAS
jgi:hypothetical protein